MSAGEGSIVFSGLKDRVHIAEHCSTEADPGRVALRLAREVEVPAEGGVSAVASV